MAGANAPAPRMYPPASVAIVTAARAERNPLLANGARKGATSMSMPSAVCIGALLVTAGAAAVGASVLAAGGSGSGSGGSGDGAPASREQLVVFRTIVEGDADTYDLSLIHI